MTDPTAPETATETAPGTTPETNGADLTEDSLVEEISIDGMCGVY